MTTPLRTIIGFAAFALVANALPGADTPPKLDGENVIYPRNAPEAGRVTRRADDGFPLWSMVGVVALLAGGGFLLLKRGALPSRSTGPGGQHLAIEETRPLGNKQYLAVARYGERRFLLAVCQGRIDLLSRLDEGERPVATPPPSKD